jgi:hypothetical protein
MAEMQAERPGVENAPENEQDAMQEDPTGPESIEILQVRSFPSHFLARAQRAPCEYCVVLA